MKKTLMQFILIFFVIINFKNDLSFTQDQNVIKVCVIPFTPLNSDIEDQAKDIYKKLINKIDDDSKYKLISFSDVQRAFPIIKNSKDINRSVTAEITNKFDVNVFITGEVDGTRSRLKVIFSITGKNSSSKSTLNSTTIDRAVSLIIINLQNASSGRGMNMNALMNNIRTQHGVNINLRQNRSLNKVFKTCVFPFFSFKSNLVSTAKSMDNDFLKKLKDINFYNIVSFDEIKRNISSINNSSDYDHKIRKILKEKLGIEIIILLELDRKPNLDYEIIYSILSANTGNRFLVYSLKNKNINALIDSAVQHLGRLEIHIFQNINHPFIEPGIPHNGVTDDGKKKWTVCLFPFNSIRHQANKITSEYNDMLEERLKLLGFLNVITLTDMQKKIPGLKNFNDFNKNIRKQLYEKFNADFILSGEVDGNIPDLRLKSTAFTTIAYSGQSYKLGIFRFDMDKVVNNVIKDFIRLRNKIFGSQPQPFISAQAKEWERELSKINRADKFEYSNDVDSGTIISEFQNTPSYPYYLHFPPNYKTSGYSYPLVVFLHGAGHRGRTFSPIVLSTSPLYQVYRIRNGVPAIDSSPQAMKSLNKYVKSSIVLIPQIILNPNTPPENWGNDELNKLIIDIIKKYPVNLKRVYIMGVSLGGLGTWQYGSALHKKVAALVPMCGSVPATPQYHSQTPYIEKSPLLDIPIWAFHAFDDNVLSYTHTTITFDDIVPGKIVPSDRNIMQNYPHRNNNPDLPADSDYTIGYYNGNVGPWERGVVYPKGKLTFTLYRTGKHDSWTPTYRNPQFWDWLYSNVRER